MEDVLKIKDLNVSYEVYGGDIKAVRNLSLTIHQDEVYALVGESGCGKSTIANTLLKLNDPHKTKVNAKEMIMSNKDILPLSEKEMSDIRGHIVSMVFQDPMSSLNPTMKVGQQIVETLYRNKTLDKSHAKQEAIRLLDLVQIPDSELRYNQYPHQLSGGMKQRVMIAIALATRPHLFIADEPTTALDVTTQAQILNVISDIQKETHTAILLITHNFGVVASLADRVGVMYAGEIVEEGYVDDIFSNPSFPYTQSLLKCLPSSTRKTLYSIAKEPPDLYETIEGCPFAKRCEYCMHICLKEKPPCCIVEKDHYVKCWLKDKDYLEQTK